MDEPYKLPSQSVVQKISMSTHKYTDTDTNHCNCSFKNDSTSLCKTHGKAKLFLALLEMTQVH